MPDIRYALRTLRKQPIFAVISILTLALGIGANTAIFSLLYQALLRPLAYPAGDRLVFIWNTYPLMGLPQAGVSIPDYRDRRREAPGLEDAALFTGRNLNLAEGDTPEQLRGLAVTPSFFSTLQRQPMLGQAFSDDHAKPGADKFVILSYTLWKTRFAADPALVGRSVRLNGEPYVVTGVMPEDFEAPARDIAAFVPFAFTPAQTSDNERGNEFSTMIARLAPGVTLDRINGEIRTVVARALERLPDRQAFSRTSGFSGYAVSMRDQLVGSAKTPLLVLQSGVILLLLIACANVANLLLMRATGRGRELAIRTTLGAGRWRLIRQMVIEGLVLSAFGALAGAALGLAGVRVLVATSARQLPFLVGASLHPAVLVFTTGLAALTGLVFGLVPAMAIMRGDPNAVLKDDSARASSGRSTGWLRAALVTGEVALALMLLVGAGLLVRSFQALQQVKPGFTSDRVLTAQLTLPPTRYGDATTRRLFWERLVAAARQIPGVTAVGLTSNIPLSGSVSSGSYSIVGYTPAANEPRPHGRQEVVGGDYFRAMQIPVVAGRVFSDTDSADSPPVVVIDQYLVTRYFANRDPLGQQIQRGGPNSPKLTIVGVVGTINAIDLSQPVNKERLYSPIAQQPRPAMAIVIKTSLAPSTAISSLRAAVRGLDPEQPLSDVRTMDDWVSRSLEGRRTPTALLAIFGGVALALAAIGIYGVLAFAVAQRVREFGIRQALGANRRSILLLVVTHGLRTAGAGLLVGLVGAFGLTRFLRTLLFDVDMHDPGVFVAVPIVLLAVALVACYAPARRATAIDPIAALRE